MKLFKNWNKPVKEQYPKISLQTLLNLQKTLIDKISEEYTYLQSPAGKKLDKKEFNKRYLFLKNTETTTVKTKMIINKLNEDIYPEIFQIAELKKRRHFLTDIKEKNNFILNEISELTKKIDKCQQTINEFNKNIIINPEDLGKDVMDALLNS